MHRIIDILQVMEGQRQRNDPQFSTTICYIPRVDMWTALNCYDNRSKQVPR